MEPLGIGNIFQVDTLMLTSVPHILEKIFFSLDHVSYTKCSAVSNAWNMLFSSECFRRLEKGVFCEDIERELVDALRQRNTHKIRKLISSGMVDVNFVHEGVGTPLTVAVKKCDTGLIQHLIEKGADVNAQDEYGKPSLLYSAEEGHSHVVKLLLDAGARPDLSGDSGIAPMHDAAKNGHIGVVQLLLNKGADVNLLTPDGYTPLHAAAIGGNKEVIKLLLKSGADHSLATHKGLTAIMIAQYCGHWNFVDEDVTDILRQYGA